MYMCIVLCNCYNSAMPNQMHQAGSKNFNFKNSVATLGINQSEGTFYPTSIATLSWGGFETDILVVVYCGLCLNLACSSM